MSKSSHDRKIEDLSRQLRNEKNEHSRTRQELQRENDRLKAHVAPWINELMAAYPPLRKLFNVLKEALQAEDPMRSAPLEDTMRSEFVSVGVNASSSATEQGVTKHARDRYMKTVIKDELDRLQDRFTREMDYAIHRMAQTVRATEWEYELPDRPVCRRTECPHRNRKQPYSAWVDGCVGCGRTFEASASRLAQAET